ncbi:SDR family oxidoreductase [Ovoidimarina sediminis]|uniref:SDR family oxidoreductase n=1 Tax=Ovoidimarina sediminis TaxID=3079856 RepID=UPI002907C2BE|nr:SDR family oxidoreductase [Rhodophyticola sp. MJ-SS7]MDU8945975.1 SDR family oxidoreductase [Rhodophyticola sp. MJ-SS7]
MTTYLVTGANKGIGLQISAQLAARGDEVIAVCRSASSELRDLGLRIIEDIDVSEAHSVARLKSELGDEKIDVLLNNAGILHGDSFGNLDYEDMVLQFRVNSLGPLRVTEALADNIADGGKVGIVSSRVGSIEDNGSGGYYGYRASKSAVNQIGMNLAHELKPRGIAVALLHPGMVATTMTGGNGIDPVRAASGLIERMDELTLETSGHFWHAEGYELPW